MTDAGRVRRIGDAEIELVEVCNEAGSRGGSPNLSKVRFSALETALFEVRDGSVAVKAKADYADEVLVVGALAVELRKSKHIAILGALGIAVACLVAAAPRAFGLAMPVASSDTVINAFETGAVIGADLLCGELLLAVCEKHDEVDSAPGEPRLRRMSRR